MGKKGMGKFVFGAALGAGLGMLFAPKKGSETREELKKKLDELLNQAKEIDVDELRNDFNARVDEIKLELKDLDKEKVLSIAKEKGAELEDKAQDLVDMAKEKGTPVLKKTAEDVLNNVIKVSKETLKKLEDK
ncbi:MAG: YtxH domain-containing protein [Bacilli bacterium]|nr:YtxH domain-containing protein [Bacilli bacterium]